MPDPLSPTSSPASPPPETAGLGALILIPVVVVLIAGGAFSAFGYFAWSSHQNETPSTAELKRLNALDDAIRAYKEERGTFPPGPSSALVRALATHSKRGVPYLTIPPHALSASGGSCSTGGARRSVTGKCRLRHLPAAGGSSCTRSGLTGRTRAARGMMCWPGTDRKAARCQGNWDITTTNQSPNTDAPTSDRPNITAKPMEEKVSPATEPASAA